MFDQPTPHQPPRQTVVRPRTSHPGPTRREGGDSRRTVSPLLAATGLLLLAVSALAGLPQPMCVYYGEARDGHGWPYTTNAHVVLLRGDQEIAAHTIQGSLSPGVNFALYAHLDDGRTREAYSPRAVRTGDLVSVVVRDAEGEKTIMEGSAVPAVGKPGEMVLIHVTAAEDADGDLLPDPWEQQLVDWSLGGLLGIEEVHPWDDFDGDGQSNWEEYNAGTFAFLDYDLLFAERLQRTPNGRLRISFLSVPGKVYGARYVTNPGLTRWTPAPLAVSDAADFQPAPIEGTGDWLSLYVPGVLAHAYFRPTVESAVSYSLLDPRWVSWLAAADEAGNPPYPESGFQPGDNGGANFGPWVDLGNGEAEWSTELGGSIGGSDRSWVLRGSGAMGRSLPGTTHHGLWQLRMVHDRRSQSFSGFNLKSAASPGFAATEVIRIGMAGQPVPSAEKGIFISTDGGDHYTFLDCDWSDGWGDTILYGLSWDERGRFVLTVNNLNEALTSRFEGMLPTSAISTLGVGLSGSSSTEELRFDTLTFQTDPAVHVERAGDVLVLSWPEGWGDYMLQSATELSSPGGWAPVVEPAVVSQGVIRVSVALADLQRYFRLSR
ncbi:MAG: hypothetical protein H7A47_05760 [Verrucomicrobiales bacterium]|nr:hypothetical protein [Verrucomicrobiales bacterium]